MNTLTTKSSHATIFSGLSQQTHRVEYGLRDGVESASPLPAGLPMLAELLREAGYETLGVTDGLFVSKRIGFDRGFDQFDDEGGGAASGARKLLSMIQRASPGEKPIFAFLHTYQTHSPYAPPADADLFTNDADRMDTSTESLIRYAWSADDLSDEALDYVRGVYDGEILHTDRVLRDLFRELEAAGFFHNHLAVVTSDHGEEFGEHGGLLHRGLLYDEFIRVPLILYGTGVPQGEVSRRLASSIDIAPTLLRFAGLSVPAVMHGTDLLADASGIAEDEEAVFAQYRRHRYAVRTRDWKLIESRRPLRIELYAVGADPREQHDVADAHPDQVDRLRRRLAEWKARQPRVVSPASSLPASPLNAAERRRLRELGYVVEE